MTYISSFSIQACRDFLVLAQTHSKKWQKSLQYERDQRIRLEETLEQLAKQHNHLERAFRGATVLPANAPGSAGSGKGELLAWLLDGLFSSKPDAFLQLIERAPDSPESATHVRWDSSPLFLLTSPLLSTICYSVVNI